MGISPPAALSACPMHDHPLAPLALALAVAPAAARENVILVVVDDWGIDKYDDTSAPFQNSKGAVFVPQTPVLRSLAEDGLYFRNAYASPVCSPTRANVQTGRYGGRTGVGVGTNSNDPNLWALQLSEWTLPEMLQSDPAVGPIATAFFGKWHLSNPNTGGDSAPNQQGYDYAWHTDTNLLPPDDYYSFLARRQGVAELVDGYATSVTVDEALAWIGTAPEPFFAVVSLHAPHTPWHFPPWTLHQSLLPWKVRPDEDPVTFYNASVEALDTEIGRLVLGLGPLSARTNLIVMGDNGTPQEAAVPPFEPAHAKATPYDGAVHVPLIVNGPAVVNPGRELGALVHAVDVFATVADLMGVDWSSHVPDPNLVVDSVSLMPYVLDTAPASLRAFTYTERFRPNGVHPSLADSFWQGAFDGRYRLLRVTDDGVVTKLELYNLLTDPFETQDLLSGGEPTPAAQVALTTLTQAMDAIVATY